MENTSQKDNHPSQTQAQQPAAQQNGSTGQTAKKKLDKPKKQLDIYAIGFIVVCGVILLLASVIEWQRNQYDEYRSKLTAIVAGVPEETTATQAQVNNLEKGFLTEDELINFITSIEQARKSFSEFQLSFASDVPEGKKHPQYLPIEITVAGRYETIVNFLERLANAEYVIRFKSGHLTSLDGFRDESTLKLSAELYVSETFGKK